MSEYDQMERVAEALERQADAMETLAEEVEYQNAVLTEVAHAVHAVAINTTEYAEPDEKRTHVPNFKSLRTRIQDQETTREEYDNRRFR